MADRPNILFIMSDDHAAHAIGAYGSRINRTPHIDRLAREGMRLNHCYCTNSICTPSRAAILTGQHAHVNGVRTLADRLDGRRPILVQKLLREAGYQTAIVGKWHLGHGGEADPTGFDYWNVLPGQGLYHDPDMIEMGEKKNYSGYVSDIISDLTLDWLEGRDPEKPFLLFCHHKAPHRPWEPGEKYASLYAEEDIPLPETLWDDYATRAEAARVARMRMEDLTERDLKAAPPENLSFEEERIWRYQRYIKDYLRCCASIDDSVGRILDYLDANGLAENTLVIYTSDQGFFLGDHGWFDKRFMYEQSLQMPFLARFPREIPAGTVSDAILTNNDFAPTFLDYAGSPVPAEMQGVSGRGVLCGEKPASWQTSLYYRYWMHKDSEHNVYSHYGVRTHRYKLIYYYGKGFGCKGASDEDTEPEWELFDLTNDPLEMTNVYADPAYAEAVRELTGELDQLQKKFGDVPAH
jgi:arylsulfatase A-like enzyme